MSDDAVPLAQRLTCGEPRALGRAISLVESGHPGGDAIVAATFEHTGGAAVTGLTGPPGAGKSTLVSALTRARRAADRRVGVVSVDPSSPFTHGAVLGDRVRMSEHYGDAGVFIRSMANRGALGGLAEATLLTIALVDAAGFDDVLVETVGVGQAEIDVVDHADTVVLVLMPGSGDAVQAVKAGIMEIPDVVVINKGDHPAAGKTAREVRMNLPGPDAHGWKAPVIVTEATTARGVDELSEAIDAHRAHLESSGTLGARRRRGLTRQVRAIALRRLAAELDEVLAEDGMAEELLARRIDPAAAAARAVAAMRPRASAR